MLRISKAQARRMGIVTDAKGGPASPPLAKAGKRAKPLRIVDNRPEPTGEVEIVVFGRPMAKEAGRQGQGRFYKPTRTSKFEAGVRVQAGIAMRACRPISGPVEIEIVQYRRVPKRLSAADRAAALSGALLPDTKPDVDNMQKSLLDGLKGIVFEDDAQICREMFTKQFGPIDRIIVRVRALPQLGVRKSTILSDLR